MCRMPGDWSRGGRGMRKRYGPERNVTVPDVQTTPNTRRPSPTRTAERTTRLGIAERTTRLGMAEHRYPASAWGNPWFPHGPPPGSCWRIGVPRFELGTSPTRTERATRLRRGGTRGSPTGPLVDRAGASGCPDSNWGPLRPERSALPGFGVGGPHGPPPGSCWRIGVPRFELGTSPTRTERATRLRHTPDRAIG